MRQYLFVSGDSADRLVIRGQASLHPALLSDHQGWRGRISVSLYINAAAKGGIVFRFVKAPPQSDSFPHETS